MRLARNIGRDQEGVAAIEMAFVTPILIVMIWMFVQFAQIYRAAAGIQQALGEGARYATLCINPGTTGCQSPPPGTGDNPATGTIKAKIKTSVYGIGPGTFTIDDPVGGPAVKYYDLKVNYEQPTNLLLVPGPTVRISRSKRVWIAST